MNYRTKLAIVCLFVPALVIGCAGWSHGYGARVVTLLANECVVIAQEEKNGTVETVCATAAELAPLLNLIMAKRTAQPDAGVDGAAHD